MKPQFSNRFGGSTLEPKDEKCNFITRCNKCGEETYKCKHFNPPNEKCKEKNCCFCSWQKNVDYFTKLDCSKDKESERERGISSGTNNPKVEKYY